MIHPVQAIDTLPAEELERLFLAERSSLSSWEAYLLEEFIERIGGEENAREAIDMLKQIEAKGVR